MIQKSPSANKHFLSAIVTKNLQMFKLDPDTHEVKHSIEIVEHLNRLLEISDNCHFYMDECAFEAYGSSGFPQRFTRVFVSNGKFKNFPRSKFYKVHQMHELRRVIETKDLFSPETKVFFIGNSKFLETCSEFANKLLLTVADIQCGITEDENPDFRFPLEKMKTIFYKRRDIQPEMLEMIKQIRKTKKKEIERFEIAENGMKIFKQTLPENNSAYDSLLDTPDYMFYEYSR